MNVSSLWPVIISYARGVIVEFQTYMHKDLNKFVMHEYGLGTASAVVTLVIVE